MKQYTKTINGNVEIKLASQIVVRRNGMQIINPNEELILSDGWKVYEIPVVEFTVEELLEQEKKRKIEEILRYDASSEVNEFTMLGIPVWLDKATRAGLMLRFQAEQAVGKTDTVLWYNNTQFPLSLEIAMQMLYALEVYASMCYDNTQMHIALVNELLTIEDVESYDYTTGYPDKLVF